MGTYSIGEMAKRLGKSVKVLQYWDKNGIFSALRSPSGRRYYTHDQLLQALNKNEYSTDNNINVIKDKVVLITGGTGSLGYALTKHICKEAKKVIVFSRCELKQARMQSVFSKYSNIRFFIGDVRNKERLKTALRGVDIVIHAAALKRVETCTYNPSEGIATNVEGTINVAAACIEMGVKKALFVSSDKAAEPITPYGYMKALSESTWINFNNYSGGSTTFMVSRYGNIINSNGSYFHLIQDQKNTGTIKITDVNMSRFYMTLDDAVALNIFALTNSISGEIFIPKVKSATIKTFIDAFAADYPTEVIGIRGVEKIAECLISDHEMAFTYDCGDYYKIIPSYVNTHNIGWDRDRPIEMPIKRFKYTSDSNDVEKLNAEDLVNMVGIV